MRTDVVVLVPVKSLDPTRAKLVRTSSVDLGERVA
jgi:hypothetical protein